MVRVQKGDKVTINYKVKLEDGTVLDATKQKEPLTFIQGEGRLLKAVEEAVVGMGLGEEKTLKISEEEGYGPIKPELFVELEHSTFTQQGIKPEIGLKVEAKQPEGNSRAFMVVAMSDSKVILDGNHPLAGLDVTYDLQLVAIH